MRVLILDQAVPFPPIGGGSLRTYHLARALAAVHDVTLVGFTFGEVTSRPRFRVDVVECPWDWPPLYQAMHEGDGLASRLATKKLATEIEEPWFVSWAQSERLEETLGRITRAGFDLALIEHTTMARFLPALPTQVPKILDLHNVHSRMALRAVEELSGQEKERAAREAERTLRFESRAASQCASCLAVSDAEAEAAKSLLGIDHVEVVPNGVDASFFSPSQEQPTDGYILFTGMMDYGPNIEAARYFAHEVLPLVRQEVPEASFHIVGANPGPDVNGLNSAQVVVHGAVPDMRPYFDKAAVVVAPLLHGGGTRLKILEAAASGKAVVSTSLGAEGLEFAPGREILLADSAADFAAAVVRLCRDESLRQRLGRNALRVAQRYDWQAIGSRLCRIIESVCEEPNPKSEIRNPKSEIRTVISDFGFRISDFPLRISDFGFDARASIKGRIFLVGCPRSGTTVLQSLLAAHPAITSFPESHFFPYVVSEDPAERAAGVVTEEARPRWQAFLEELGCPQLDELLPSSARSVGEYVEAFVRLLDTLTLRRQKERWLEKTPDHLQFVDVVEEFIPGAQFLHLLRDGPDVVASLYEVTRQHPKIWHGAWSIDRCIDKWNHDTVRAKVYSRRPNHFLVRYEELVERPEAVLRDVCQFLEVAFDPGMLEQHSTAARSLVLPNEPWKARVFSAIRKTEGSKFQTLFDEQQRAYILGRLIKEQSEEFEESAQRS